MDHANPEEVAKVAADWSDEYIECRVDHHDLRALDARFDQSEGTLTRVRRCRRCHVDQIQIWSLRTGEVLRRGMDYSRADGYLLPKGTGIITGSSRNTIRLEMLSRLMDQAGQRQPAPKRLPSKKQTRGKPIRPRTRLRKAS